MIIRKVLGALAALTIFAAAPQSWADDEFGARIMTRNLYIGANVFEAFTDPGAVLVKIIESDFPSRARLLAQEIQQRQPFVVGLQEVWNIEATPNLPVVPAIEIDFLELLMAELAKKGDRYEVALSQTNLDVEIDVPLGGGLFYEGLVQDRDVILVRKNVSWSNGFQDHFSYLAPTPLGFDIPRGLQSIDVVFDGNPFRFVNTHLEVEDLGDGALFQTLQAVELQEVLYALATRFGMLPEIVVGDFNSDLDDPGCTNEDFCVGTPLEGVSPYKVMAGGFFTDTWYLKENKTETSGDTCCFESLDSADNPSVSRRVDLIWIRGADASDVTVRLSGDDPKRTTPGGLYGSDHLGVMARMTLIPAY